LNWPCGPASPDAWNTTGQARKEGRSVKKRKSPVRKQFRVQVDTPVATQMTDQEWKEQMEDVEAILTGRAA